MDNLPMQMDLIDENPSPAPVENATTTPTGSTGTDITTDTTIPNATSMTSAICVDGGSSIETGFVSSAMVGTSNTGITIDTSIHSSTGVQSPPKHTITITTAGSSNTKSSLVMTSGKRKLWQDGNAPKAPLSAYLQFLNKNREAIRSKNPGMGVHDTTKVLGSMWSELPLDQKQIYLDQAERDKKQYVAELEQYLNSDTYKTFIEQREKAIKALKQEEKSSPGSHLVCIPCNKWFENTHNFREHAKSRKHQRNMLEAQTRGRKSKKSTVTGKKELPVETGGQKKTPTQAIPQTSKNSTQANNFPDMSGISEGDLEIPVFSDAFLHYNKSRESELRKLRKATTEIEEQNAILSKHIDNLNSVIGKLEDEKTESEEDIKILEPFLKNIHELLAKRFSKSELLDAGVQLTESNTREFLVKLCNNHPLSDSTIAEKLKEVFNDLNYPNCLENISLL